MNRFPFTPVIWQTSKIHLNSLIKNKRFLGTYIFFFSFLTCYIPRDRSERHDREVGKPSLTVTSQKHHQMKRMGYCCSDELLVQLRILRDSRSLLRLKRFSPVRVSFLKISLLTLECGFEVDMSLFLTRIFRGDERTDIYGWVYLLNLIKLSNDSQWLHFHFFEQWSSWLTKVRVFMQRKFFHYIPDFWFGQVKICAWKMPYMCVFK